MNYLSEADDRPHSENESEEVTWKAFRALNDLSERYRLSVADRENYWVSVEEAETEKRDI